MNSAIMKYAVAALVIMAVCQTLSAATTTYKYDALGRVSVVTQGDSVIRYFYDPAGHRGDRAAKACR